MTLEKLPLVTVQEVIQMYTLTSFNVCCVLIELPKAFEQFKINILIYLSWIRLKFLTLFLKLLGFVMSQSFVNVKFIGMIGDECKNGNYIRQG